MDTVVELVSLKLRNFFMEQI